MAEKIKAITPDQLPQVSSINLSDLFIIYQDKKFKAITYTDLKALLGSGDSVETIQYSENSTYTLNANTLLEKIVVFTTADISLKLGTTLNGDEILIETEYVADSASVILLDIYRTDSLTIYISGITSDTTIKFYKK